MIKDLVTKSRSYRGYNENRKLTKEELLDLVDCARLCPSTVNAQPLRYYLAWEKEEVDKIQSLTAWAKALTGMAIPHPGMHPTAFIIILQDTKLASNQNIFMRDVGIVAQTMLLAATEQGLGGCMIGNFIPEQVQAALNLPEHLIPMLVVAFGEPAEQIVLTEIDEGESVRYYRDENDVHYVPKRKLKDIVITGVSME